MFKAFTHIIIAFSVLISTTGFWTSSHYCQGEQVNSKLFFSLGESCAALESSPCSTKKMSCEDGENKGCCDSVPQIYQLDQNQIIDQSEFSHEERKININYIFTSTIQLDDQQDKRIIEYLNYSPPLIVYDRCVRFQSFLC